MKSVKIFIVLVCLLSSYYSAAAQSSEILWRNLRPSYESFSEVKPIIYNNSARSIYYFESWYGFFTLLRFDETSGNWKSSDRFICGNNLTISPNKLSPQTEILLPIDDWVWDELTSGNQNFKSTESYSGKGRYKLQLTYSTKKKEQTFKIVSISPEFEVVEKDFKK